MTGYTTQQQRFVTQQKGKSQLMVNSTPGAQMLTADSHGDSNMNSRSRERQEAAVQELGMIQSSGGHSQMHRTGGGYAQANHSKIAGNMTLSEAPNKAGVVMQVNKYVPYYNRIPKIEKKDFTMFTYGVESEAEQ